MKETAISNRKGGGRRASTLRAASSSLRPVRGGTAPKSSLHVCPHCRRAFPFNVALQLHIKDHLVPNSFKCNLCTAGFSSKYQLSVHLRKHSGLDLYKCDQCSVKFINGSNLQRHIRNGVCHKREVQKESNVERSSEFTKPVSVDTISRAGNEQTSCDLTALKTLERTDQQSCEACNETFASLEDYSHHEDLHKTGNIFTCRNCSKNFCTLPRLSGETLGEDEKYWRNKCMLCGATCHSDNDLFIHLRRHLDNNEDLYCKQCQSSRRDIKENTIALSVSNETSEGISTDQPQEAAPASCLSSVSSNDITNLFTVSSTTSNNPPLPFTVPSTTSNNTPLLLTVSSTTCNNTPLPFTVSSTTSNNPPLPFSHLAPLQTTAYFTTNLSNVSNFVGAVYHQPDGNNVHQKVLQPVCSVVPASTASCSDIDLCGDGVITQTSGVLATVTPGIFMVNPTLRRSNTTQSFPCTTQILSSVPADSGGSVASCVPVSWPSDSSCTRQANVAVTSCSRPSIAVASPSNLVSCLAANDTALTTPSSNYYTNQTISCLPCPEQ